MLEGNLEIAALAGRQRNRLRGKEDAGLAQNDLIHLIGKFHGDFDVGDGRTSRIRDPAVEDGHFLVEKVFRAARHEIFD